MAKLLYDFLSTETPKTPHIIGRGILPVAGKAIIGGPTKSNKSFVTINAMLDLVRGQHLFDAKYRDGVPVFPVKKAYRVLYFENEIGADGLKERILGITGGEIPAGLELYIQSRDLSLRLDTPEGLTAINQQVAAVQPDVVVFDPLTKFHLADENSAQEMGRVMRAGDRIIEAHKCAIVYIHHTGKESVENPRVGGNKLRGSSAIFADVDTFIEVRPLSEANVLEPLLTLDFTIRQGKPIEPVQIKRLESGRVAFVDNSFPKLAAPAVPAEERESKQKGIKAFQRNL